MCGPRYARVHVLYGCCTHACMHVCVSMALPICCCLHVCVYLSQFAIVCTGELATARRDTELAPSSSTPTHRHTHALSLSVWRTDSHSAWPEQQRQQQACAKSPPLRAVVSGAGARYPQLGRRRERTHDLSRVSQCLRDVTRQQAARKHERERAREVGPAEPMVLCARCRISVSLSLDASPNGARAQRLPPHGWLARER